MRLLAFALLITTPAIASTPATIDQGLSDAKLACRKASDLKNAATLGKPVMLDDHTGKIAVLVTGIWRPALMKGARGTMLCLYDRASKMTEVQEAKGWGPS
jgi:hypothetical protein